MKPQLTIGRPGDRPDDDKPNGKPETKPYPKPDQNLLQDQIKIIKESEVDDATKERFFQSRCIGGKSCLFFQKSFWHKLLVLFKLQRLYWQYSVCIAVKTPIFTGELNWLVKKLEKELLSKLFTTMQSKEYLQQHHTQMVNYQNLHKITHNLWAINFQLLWLIIYES